MKFDRRCLILLLCSVILFCAGTGAAAEAVRDAEADTSLYRDLLLSFDYGDTITYVIGHKSPDSDTVGSAMAYAYLLNEIGIPAQAVVSAPVNTETAYALGVFGIEAPPVMDHAEGKQFVLVDHSSYTQAIDGMRDARVVSILDHHGIGDVAVSELIHARSAPIGATATLVYLSYVECQVEIPREMAQVMLMALLSDTQDLDKQVTLAEIAGIADLESPVQGHDGGPE